MDITHQSQYCVKCNVILFIINEDKPDIKDITQLNYLTLGIQICTDSKHLTCYECVRKIFNSYLALCSSKNIEQISLNDIKSNYPEIIIKNNIKIIESNKNTKVDQRIIEATLKCPECEIKVHPSFLNEQLIGKLKELINILNQDNMKKKTENSIQNINTKIMSIDLSIENLRNQILYKKADAKKAAAAELVKAEAEAAPAALVKAEAEAAAALERQEAAAALERQEAEAAALKTVEATSIPRQRTHNRKTEAAALKTVEATSIPRQRTHNSKTEAAALKTVEATSIPPQRTYNRKPDDKIPVTPQQHNGGSNKSIISLKNLIHFSKEFKYPYSNKTKKQLYTELNNINIDNFEFDQLIKYCKFKNIKSYSKCKNKKSLIKLIKSSQ